MRQMNLIIKSDSRQQRTVYGVGTKMDIELETAMKWVWNRFLLNQNNQNGDGFKRAKIYWMSNRFREGNELDVGRDSEDTDEHRNRLRQINRYSKTANKLNSIEPKM